MQAIAKSAFDYKYINQSINQFDIHSGWLKKTNTHKFDIKIIKNNQIMANSYVKSM